ncbi:AAA family ATPase [Fusarium bulbicola]|nr:AAA family ATPase [Fusarium bulbicola]
MASKFRFNTSVTEESVSPSKVSSCPPAIGADIEDRHKSSYWSLENDSERRMLPHSEITRDLVIDLPKLRQYEDSDAEHPSAGPAIIWTARVYQILKEPRGDGIRLYRPDLTYVDDRPIDFSIGLSPMKPPPETDEDVSEPEKWTGPVLTIETFVEADIDQYKLSRMKEQPEKHLSTAVPRVEFGMIWYLLKPGIDVYAQVDGSTHAAVVVGVRRSDISVSKLWGDGSDGAWLVDLWRLETDGSRLRRGFFSALITPYFGLRDVASLQALQRGNLLADYNGPIKNTAQYYTGKVVVDHRRGRAESNISCNLSPKVHDYSDRFKEYDGILINNYRSFYTTQDTQNRLTNRKSRPPNSNDAVMNQERLQVQLNDVEHRSPETIRTHAGVLISIDHAQESAPSNESISNLIIARDELKTIQVLSNRQTRPPGVGKTYTVEAISEWLHRPLLDLTVADIGTVETLVEGELMKWFDLAEAWNAVLLVDEADIFLERRQNRDLARNGLVSAITLAEFESEEDPDYDASLVTVVTKAHFQKVLEMCNRFRSYVTSIRREDEMKRAQGRGDRNDYGNGFDSRMC